VNRERDEIIATPEGSSEEVILLFDSRKLSRDQRRIPPASYYPSKI